MSEKLFYLKSRHGNCGSNVMFHNKNGSGYGTNVNDLETYTKEKAQKEYDWDEGQVPLLKSLVDALTVSHVDMQYLDRDKNGIDLDGKYVVQLETVYDGNDIAFVSDQGYTFDLNKATVFKKELSNNKRNPIVWSLSYLKTIERKTFQQHNVTRAMTRGAGIKKNHKKKRPTSGKTRWNCPICGRISWQYDPYNFEGCNDSSCEGWRYSEA